MEIESLKKFIDLFWENSALFKLKEYIKIPCLSPQFDGQWEKKGFIAEAAYLLAEWCKTNAPEKMHLEILECKGRTPCLFIDISGSIEKTVLFYGHLDKQPEIQAWSEGLSPWIPVIHGDKLYGRGSADDGYALFAALGAIKAVQYQKQAHPRCLILIEASEESGSPDLPFYLEIIRNRLNTPPDLVIGLDSGGLDDEHLWLTTSLRGTLTAILNIEVATKGTHSGLASGIVPSSFRILRTLLNRVENTNTGDILLSSFHVSIPEQRIEQAKYLEKVIGERIYKNLFLYPDCRPQHDSPYELILNNTWRPTLSVTGIEGLPSLEKAGNVIQPFTQVKLSFRLPPSCPPDSAAQTLKTVLESDPPYQAKVTCHIVDQSGGWNAPLFSTPNLRSYDKAAHAIFEKPVMYMGLGGTIPFVSQLGQFYPQAQFFITGVVTPDCGIHGPDEFLSLSLAKKLTATIALLLMEPR